jgi:hypothetical protein
LLHVVFDGEADERRQARLGVIANSAGHDTTT